MVCAAGLLLAACGGGAPASSDPAATTSPTDPTAVVVTPGPSPVVVITPDPSQAPLPTASPTDAVDLVTYEPGSACASVQTTTTVDRVPAACAAAWKPYSVRDVPGQDAMKRTPHLPQILALKGVNPVTAQRLAFALWRTETFQAFALSTRQLGIVDGLGQNYFFRVVGIEEQAVQKGNTVSTPLCHFFPTQIRVLPLAKDFASYAHRPEGSLGVEATYTGPCYATATDTAGKTAQLFRFDGQRKVVYVGDIGKGDPEGPVLTLTSLGECDQPVVKATCAQ